MARRKINLQDSGRKTPPLEIDQLVRDLGTSDLGFSPTDQVIYEVELSRIRPDFEQSRHLMPFDLREKMAEHRISTADAMAELARRAEQGNQLALLILGGRADLVDDEEETEPDEDKGLLALASSIRTIGLRQPINLYSISDPDNPGVPFYQLGEGERRYWAHQVLVLQGHHQFSKIRAVIEPLPDDQSVVQRRQEAENAARQDLSAIARARSIKRIRNRLSLSLGTRVPGQTTIKLPGQRELDAAVGQEVKSFTGRAISGRMVRNYMRLLTLSSGLQDLAEAAQLSEKQLRAVMRLKTDAEQLHLIKQIINEKLSGRAVMDRVSFGVPQTSLKRTIPTTLEQRLEKRLFQTAKTVHEVLTLGEESYADIIQLLSTRLNEQATKEALLGLRRVINDLLGLPQADAFDFVQTISLSEILPPLDALPKLPDKYRELLEEVSITSIEILERLQDWRQSDPMIASTTNHFFEQVEFRADKIKAREEVLRPTVRRIEDVVTREGYEYEMQDGKLTFWAHVLLVMQGDNAFEIIPVSFQD